MLHFVASWQSQGLSVKKIKKICSKWSLIRLICAWIRLWSDLSHPEVTSDHTIPRPKWPLIRPFPSWSDLWSYYHQAEVTSDQTIPILKWPLIILSPGRSDLWSYHPQTEVTSDHTIVRSNQIPDPVILVSEHTVCVGLGLISGHFWLTPQPGQNVHYHNCGLSFWVGNWSAVSVENRPFFLPALIQVDKF